MVQQKGAYIMTNKCITHPKIKLKTYFRTVHYILRSTDSGTDADPTRMRCGIRCVHRRWTWLGRRTCVIGRGHVSYLSTEGDDDKMRKGRMLSVALWPSIMATLSVVPPFWSAEGLTKLGWRMCSCGASSTATLFRG